MQLDAEPDRALREQILAPLIQHNETAAGPGHFQPLAVTVRDASGTVAGGLWGYSHYEFLFIEILALGAARGAGLGRQVMQLAEAEAHRRGLRGIWLDTWTFQAPGFYPKFGFVECGRITGYPAGHDRIFFVKRLAP